MKEKIKKIEVNEYVGDVFNLEVEPFHPTKDDQFYIDNETGIIIHNCHPRDNIAMSWLSNKLGLSYNFFDDIMKGRERQTEFLCELILQNPGPYYILGKTFKEETNLIIGSPAILLGNILSEKGVDYTQYDPFIDDREPLFEKGTYFIATRHEEFKKFKFPEGSIVIDVWRYLNLTDNRVTYIKVGDGKYNNENKNE